jgi:hypothetical protein
MRQRRWLVVGSQNIAKKQGNTRQLHYRISICLSNNMVMAKCPWNQKQKAIELTQNQ